jgi:LmbE family N-acetylglucosaminyl deacetylase
MSENYSRLPVQGKRLLAVLAHPDDESFGMGGTLALYAARGAEVYLVCATRGEAGAAEDEHLEGFSSVAEMREAELRCAAAILNLKQVHFLGYRDSGMPGSPDNNHPEAQIMHPLNKVADQVVQIMRELKPDIVLTFDPIGGYRHPDHIHIQQATTLAFERAGDADYHPELGVPHAPRALYYHTISKGFLRAAVFVLRLIGKDPRRFGRNGDIDLAMIASQDFPVHARINIRSAMGKKEQASACHHSQGGGMRHNGLLGWLRLLFGGTETFMRAHPPVPVGGRVVRDLFDLQDERVSRDVG